MANKFSSDMNIPRPLAKLASDEIAQARIDLAACFRFAARLGFQEGICNHFSALVPGHDHLFLVNPYGLAFEEITASSLLVCDFDGNTVAGEGQPEITAFYIHARLHANNSRARVAFHTHMPNATALAMLEGEPLVWASQSCLKFYGRISVDENYNGLAMDVSEGDRIAAAMGDADVVFLKNHGVLVVGASIAQVWDDLYYLERAAEVQLKAMSTGRVLKPVSQKIAEAVAQQMASGGADAARQHLASIKRILYQQEPDFAS